MDTSSNNYMHLMRNEMIDCIQFSLDAYSVDVRAASLCHLSALLNKNQHTNELDVIEATTCQNVCCLQRSNLFYVMSQSAVFIETRYINTNANEIKCEWHTSEMQQFD